MKQMHDLLEYIDEYEYDFDQEKIIIHPGERCESATACYEIARDTISPQNMETRTLMLGEELTGKLSEAYSRYKELNDEVRRLWMTTRFSAFDPWYRSHWFLDVALDVVRKLPEDQRERLRENPDPFTYHFSLGLGIRNRYVLCAKEHISLMPDRASSRIMSMIFSIVNEEYDYRKEHARAFEYLESQGLVQNFRDTQQL